MDDEKGLSGLQNEEKVQTSDVHDAEAIEMGLQITTALLWTRSAHDLTRINGPPISNGTSVTAKDHSSDTFTESTTGETDSDRTFYEDKPDRGLLPLHQDRLTAAAKALQWQSNTEDFETVQHSISHLREEIEAHLQSLPPISSPTKFESRKVRVLIDRHGTVQVDSAVINLRSSINDSSKSKHSPPTFFIPHSFDDSPSNNESNPSLTSPSPPPPPCIIHLDTQPTPPSLYTTHKTTSRSMYSAARTRVNIPSTTPPTVVEVLLYNTNGEVMETSACTIYFRGGDGRWVTPSAGCGPNMGVTRRVALERGLCEEGVVVVEELRGRSARVLEWWVKVGVVGMGELWEEWEGMVEECERVVRRVERRRGEEEGYL